MIPYMHTNREVMQNDRGADMYSDCTTTELLVRFATSCAPSFYTADLQRLRSKHIRELEYGTASAALPISLH
jgi:hypothetical protein